MNKSNYFFWIGFTFVAFLQLTNGLTAASDTRLAETIDVKTTLADLGCNNFTMYTLNARGKSLDLIKPDALWNCTEAAVIDLSQNKIIELHPDTFKFNTKTDFLTLHCNKLSVLPNEIFKPLKKLGFLSLSGNPLRTIDAVLNGGLIRLWQLDIEVIELPELDPVLLKEKLPNLRTINFPGNLIECSVYESVKSKLSTLGITTFEKPDACVNLKKKCLTREEKAAIVQKQQETHQKIYPLLELLDLNAKVGIATNLFVP